MVLGHNLNTDVDLEVVIDVLLLLSPFAVEGEVVLVAVVVVRCRVCIIVRVFRILKGDIIYRYITHKQGQNNFKTGPGTVASAPNPVIKMKSKPNLLAFGQRHMTYDLRPCLPRNYIAQLYYHTAPKLHKKAKHQNILLWNFLDSGQLFSTIIEPFHKLDTHCSRKF